MRPYMQEQMEAIFGNPDDVDSASSSANLGSLANLGELVLRNDGTEDRPKMNCYTSGAANLGRAVQIDPIKPKLAAPGDERSKLKFDKLLSSFAFNLNLRRFTWVLISARRTSRRCQGTTPRQGLTLVHFSAQFEG